MSGGGHTTAAARAFCRDAAALEANTTKQIVINTVNRQEADAMHIKYQVGWGTAQKAT